MIGDFNHIKKGAVMAPFLVLLIHPETHGSE